MMAIGLILLIAALFVPRRALGSSGPANVGMPTENEKQVDQFEKLAEQFADTDPKTDHNPGPFSLSQCDKEVIGAILREAPPNCTGKHPIVHAELLRWLTTDFGAQTIIRGSPVVVNKSTIQGELYLEYTAIASPLLITSSTLDGGINAQNVSIPQIELLSSKLSYMHFYNTRIGGDLRVADSAIKQYVRLQSTQIGGALDLSNSCVGWVACPTEPCPIPKGDGGELSITNSSVEGLFSVSHTFLGGAKVLVEYTSVDVLADDFLNCSGPGSLTSWPTSLPGRTTLKEFTFNRLRNAGTPESRIDWLANQQDSVYDVFDRVAQSYRDHGSNLDASEIEDVKYNAHLKSSTDWQYVLGWFMWATVGYGYHPFRVLISIGLFWLLGAVIFRFASKSTSKLIVPSDSSSSAQYPQFNSLVFSFETLLPLIKFGQQDAWLVSPASVQGQMARLLRFYYWMHILIGYILTALFLVALSPDGATRLNALWT
jgi:hypothetical protein